MTVHGDLAKAKGLSQTFHIVYIVVEAVLAGILGAPGWGKSKCVNCRDRQGSGEVDFPVRQFDTKGDGR
jgi:hypothetical protein